MSENVLIKGKNYNLTCNYKEDNRIRDSFNDLTEKTYGFNFKQWYEDGYWGDSYIPYSLLDGEKVVANVSINVLDFLVLGERKRYVQIGTVMTDEAYRGQGLSRALMEIVLKEWEDKCDLIYLFANDSVLDFYPKFGFEICDEYQYTISKLNGSKSGKVSKLNMDSEKDREFVYKMACQTVPFSKVSMRNNPSLVMFYCISFMKDSIYYLEDDEAVVICDYDENVIYIHDVYSTKEIKLETIIDAIATKETKKVVLGFTPNDVSSYERSLLKEEDTTLFIKSGKENPFTSEHIMFPVLSHA